MSGDPRRRPPSESNRFAALHAAFWEDALYLWAESAGAPRKIAVETKGTPSAGLNAGAKRLAALAAELGLADDESPPAARKATLWLPIANAAPIGSLALFEDGSRRNVRLQPRSVTALALGPRESVALAANCAGKRVLRPGLLVGADLAFWAAALRFAGGLVMRGRFLPGVLEVAGSGLAAWRPAILGDDAERLTRLAEAMPPAARALRRGSAAAPPNLSSRAALEAFIEFVADELVRGPGQRPMPAAESVHDRWMRALASPAPFFEADKAELDALVAHSRRWLRPAAVAAQAPFRLCFRLEEPSSDSKTWLLRYLTQSREDPSLMLPLSAAWKPSRTTVRALGENAPLIREHLLASLGRAAALCPEIAAGLAGREPESCAMDAAAAHRFLREVAPALEQSGFGVMLPAWWTRSGSRARLAVRAGVRSPAASAGGGFSLESLVRFDWEVALGDERVSEAELRELARLKAPLVRIRGQWMEVRPEQIQAALQFLESKSSRDAPASAAVRLALGVDAPEAGLEFAGVKASGWLGEMLARLEGDARFEELPPPPELRAELRPYQLRGYSWLSFLTRWGFGACLADDMGLGKTLQALALVRQCRREGERRPVLVVCPTSVVDNWRREAERFTPDLAVLTHHGAARRRGAAFERQAAEHAIVISSYALLQRDVESLARVNWAGAILDEAQNIKNPETKQARAARSLRLDRRVALTGTPVENNVGDLWSLMEFLNPGFLGSYSGFKRRFFTPIQIYGDQEAAGRLRRVTAPFILRRLKSDKTVISDLPKKFEMKVYCTLTKEQASLYAAVAREAQQAIESAEGIERKGVVLATLTKLKQVCNHPAQFLKDNSSLAGRSGKLTRLTEMIEETIAAGDHSLVFTQYAEMGELIRAHLRDSFGIEAPFLHGGVPKARRDAMVARFNNDADAPPIFVLSLKAGGSGLNLTRANHVFHFDRWWNPAVENQAADRAYRIGQTKDVQVRKFVCAGTLEERVDEMIERKQDVAGRVVGSGEGRLFELSNAELRDLFALRREAIEE